MLPVQPEPQPEPQAEPQAEPLTRWAFSLLRYWLKAVFVPVNRKFSVLQVSGSKYVREYVGAL